MAKQIQINFRDFAGLSEGELDHLVYETTKFIQSRIPCKMFGYGVVEVEDPEKSKPISVTGEPAVAEETRDTPAPIRMLADALL